MVHVHLLASAADNLQARARRSSRPDTHTIFSTFISYTHFEINSWYTTENEQWIQSVLK